MRRALIVGIDDYPNAPLSGCVADAKRLEKVLAKHHDGSPNFDCMVVTSPPGDISRGRLRQLVTNLFGQPADVAWLHFSGHGTRNDLGGYLVTPDAVDFDVGVSMADILAMANGSEVSETVITLDCCHSGAFGHAAPLKDTQVALAEGVSVLTGTRASQAALEIGGGGVFTSLLVDGLEGGAAGIRGEVNAAGLYALMDSALGAWDQRPMFRTNVSRFELLRCARPRISIELLRKIPTHFPVPAEDLSLDPSYEPTAEPRDPVHEAAFEELLKLRSAGLVEPVGEEHMYYAAMNSKACRLTALGLHYWRLVSNNRL